MKHLRHGRTHANVLAPEPWMGVTSLQQLPASVSNNCIITASNELSFPPVESLAVSVRRRILFVTTEFDGLVSVGGLGAVSAALPRALRREYDVRVLIPG